MKVNEIALTECERQILASYCCFAEGLSHYLGKSYEIILHSLEDFDHSAIRVINGYHTGRKEGAPITNLALSMLARIQEEPEAVQDVTYFTKNKKGEPMKSTTITIRGEGKRIIGLLCINFYLNTSLADLLDDLSPRVEESRELENFAGNSNEWILETVGRIKKEVYQDPSIASYCKNKEIVKRLNDEGIFNLKDSVVMVAEAMNISKNTVYLHLRNFVGA
ncbi:MAG: PAS domain-containing protein [Oscillospiraceae bacterium]|nr:PAS domain-containing protein [Oscillospiraceae bacterium]